MLECDSVLDGLALHMAGEVLSELTSFFGALAKVELGGGVHI